MELFWVMYRLCGGGTNLYIIKIMIISGAMLSRFGSVAWVFLGSAGPGLTYQF